jgi:hypothetical protein
MKFDKLKTMPFLDMLQITKMNLSQIEGVLLYVPL